MLVRFITGDDLRRARLSVNRTTTEMAKKLGVSRVTLENWELEISQPKINQALELLIYCHLDIQPLLTQLAALTTQFKNHQENDINKPNACRASKRKNHLKQAKPQTEPQTERKELDNANEDIDTK